MTRKKSDEAKKLLFVPEKEPVQLIWRIFFGPSIPVSPSDAKTLSIHSIDPDPELLVWIWILEPELRTRKWILIYLGLQNIKKRLIIKKKTGDSTVLTKTEVLSISQQLFIWPLRQSFSQ
jgi:hypothetical protein